MLDILWETDLLELARWWAFAGIAAVGFNNFVARSGGRMPSLKDDCLTFLLGPAYWTGLIGGWFGGLIRIIFGGR